MRKRLKVYWKITIIIISLIVITLCFALILDFKDVSINISSMNRGKTPYYKTHFEPSKASEGSLEEVYRDIFISLLIPYIDEAVEDYYMKNTGYYPSVDPWSPIIIYVERPNGYRTFSFRIKLEISPYLGAHNTIGVDHITIDVNTGSVEIVKFEHVKSYPIPPHLR